MSLSSFPFARFVPLMKVTLDKASANNQILHLVIQGHMIPKPKTFTLLSPNMLRGKTNLNIRCTVWFNKYENSDKK